MTYHNIPVFSITSWRIKTYWAKISLVIFDKNQGLIKLPVVFVTEYYQNMNNLFFDYYLIYL